MRTALVLSNIPGPAAPLYMYGCRLVEAYPVVPLADRQGLSIGVSTVCGRACFELYADRRSLPDADLLARELDREIRAAPVAGHRQLAPRRQASRTPTASDGAMSGPSHAEGDLLLTGATGFLGMELPTRDRQHRDHPHGS